MICPVTQNGAGKSGTAGPQSSCLSLVQAAFPSPPEGRSCLGGPQSRPPCICPSLRRLDQTAEWVCWGSWEPRALLTQLIHFPHPAYRTKHAPAPPTAHGVIILIFIATPTRKSKSLPVRFCWLFSTSLSKLIKLLPRNFLPSKFPTTFNHKLVITLGFSGFH